MSESSLSESALRGRRIVRLVAGTGLVLVGLATIFSVVRTLNIFSTFGFNAIMTRGSLFVRLVLAGVMVAIAVFLLLDLYRGREWARWVTVVWFLWRSLSLFLGAFTDTQGSFQLVPALITLGVACALVLPPSVREFYRQRRSGVGVPYSGS